MTNMEKVKNTLEELLPKILDDEENLKRFVFFFNMLENTHIPIEEFRSVLEDYLAVCNETSMKGRKRVTHINDRHNFCSEQFPRDIDAKKIENIANAVLDNTGVRLYISLEDFKRRYKTSILRNDERRKGYKDLMEQYQEGDAIEEIVSPYRMWKQLCGRAAIVLTRNGEYVCGIHKAIS